MDFAYNTANELVDQGISIVPCYPRSKVPALRSWRQYRIRLPNKKEIHNWFWDRISNNIAAVTGDVSNGLCILDIDGGILKALRWVKDHPMTQETRQVRTARGIHIWCRVKQAPTRDITDDGVEIKYNKLCMVPPSTHPEGMPYRWSGSDKILTVDSIECMGVREGAVHDPTDKVQIVPCSQNGILDTVTGEIVPFSRVNPSVNILDIPEQVRNIEDRRAVIQDVKAQVSILPLMNLAVDPRAQGRFRKFRCCDPGHIDNHPSLIYDTQTNRIRCMTPSCRLHNNDRWMDVIDIYRYLYGGDLWQVLTNLGQSVGMF